MAAQSRARREEGCLVDRQGNVWGESRRTPAGQSGGEAVCEGAAAQVRSHPGCEVAVQVGGALWGHTARPVLRSSGSQ